MFPGLRTIRIYTYIIKINKVLSLRVAFKQKTSQFWTMKAGCSLQAMAAEVYTTTHVLRSNLPRPAGWPRAESSWKLRTYSCLLCKGEWVTAFKRTELGSI